MIIETFDFGRPPYQSSIKLPILKTVAYIDIGKDPLFFPSHVFFDTGCDISLINLGWILSITNGNFHNVIYYNIDKDQRIRFWTCQDLWIKIGNSLFRVPINTEAQATEEQFQQKDINDLFMGNRGYLSPSEDHILLGYDFFRREQLVLHFNYQKEQLSIEK